MKDDLYQLIDGELPDDSAAEVLHLLSVDPEKRELFHQQMRLQGALHRNEGYGAMTPAEQTAMLGRLGTAIGLAPEAVGVVSEGWKGAGRISALLIGLMVGAGLGYVGGNVIRADEPLVRVDTVMVTPVQQAPPLVEPLNRDSIVAAIRDSLTQVQAASTKPTAPRKSVSSRLKKPSSTNDLTGAPEVKKLKKKKR